MFQNDLETRLTLSVLNRYFNHKHKKKTLVWKRHAFFCLGYLMQKY